MPGRARLSGAPRIATEAALDRAEAELRRLRGNRFEISRRRELRRAIAWRERALSRIHEAGRE